MWQQWINLILGLWIALSAYLGFSGGGMTTNLTIVGLVVAVLALWGALSYRTDYSGEHRHA